MAENTQHQNRGNRPAGAGAGRPPMRRGGPRRGGSFERVKPEFDHKVIDVRRVARVMAGGRRFNFAVTLVAGDKKGRVGVGTGKAGDTSLAIDKATNAAKRNMITVKTDKNGSIHGEVLVKYGSTQVLVKAAPSRGMIAGSAARDVLELAGVRNANAKILSRSKNKLNIARATIEALKRLQ